MPGGRPTDYNEEVLVKSKKYINGGWIKAGNKVPSIEGLAKAVNRSRATLYNWAKEEDKPEFLDILETLRENQLEELQDKGLSGEFNSTITKLMMGRHGIHEKMDIENSGGLTVKHTGISESVKLLRDWTGRNPEGESSEDSLQG